MYKDVRDSGSTTGSRLNKLRKTHTMEYYVALKISCFQKYSRTLENTVKCYVSKQYINFILSYYKERLESSVSKY